MEKLSLGSFLEESELMRDLDRKTSGVDERFLFMSPINRKQMHRNRKMSHTLRYTIRFNYDTGYKERYLLYIGDMGTSTSTSPQYTVTKTLRTNNIHINKLKFLDIIKRKFQTNYLYCPQNFTAILSHCCMR